MSNSITLSTFTSPSAIWLIIWMVNNIGVTLLNKAAFAKVKFPYPWLLSAIHMMCNYIGCLCVFWSLHCSKRNESTYSSIKQTTSNNDDDEDKIENDRDGIERQQHQYHQSCVERMLGGNIERKALDRKSYYFMMVPFSVLFSLNIAIGNVSLNYVSVNFNQVMRSLVPAVTILLGMCLGKTFSFQRKLAVVPIMLGVAMACFGDMSYTAIGFFFTSLCVFLAALKAVASGELLTGDLKLHPVDLLGYMAPLAMIQCLIISTATGEISEFLANWDTLLNPSTVGIIPMLIVWSSGIASFTLNISSFQANKLTSPLTLCIAANVKQVLMIWLGTVIFETLITPLNGAGIAVVLLGSARYSYVSVLEKIPAKTLTSKSSSVHMDTETDDENEVIHENDSLLEMGGQQKS